MAKESTRTVMVGIFTFLMLIAVGGLLIWQSDAFRRVSGFELIGRFDHVGGIINGAAVRYRGYTVGKVKSITPQPKYIDVVFFVEGHIKIPKESTVKILFDGLVGENYIQINPSLNEDGFMTDNDFIYGKSGSDLANFIDLGSQNLLLTEDILIAIKAVVTDQELFLNVKDIAKNVNVITSEIANISEKSDIPSLLAETQESVAVFKELLLAIGNAENLESIQNSLDQLNKATLALSNDDMWLGIETVVKNAEQVSESLNTLIPKRSDNDGAETSIFDTKIGAHTNVLYSGTTQTGYFDSLIDISNGRFGFVGGISNKLGPIQFQHFQQMYRFSDMLRGRIGIFYNQEGVGFDFYADQRIRFYTELYDFDNFYYLAGSSIQLYDQLDVLFHYRKDSVLVNGGVDFGVQHTF